MMVADFYTKPLQEKLFRIFKNMIMNLGDIKTERVHDADKLSVLGYEIQPNQTKVKSHDVPLKECIGENRQRKIRNAGMG